MKTVGTAQTSGYKVDISKEEILEAIKIVAATKPAPVEPFSLGMIGGVKIVSNPQMPDSTIMVSDDIFAILSKANKS